MRGKRARLSLRRLCVAKEKRNLASFLTSAGSRTESSSSEASSGKDVIEKNSATPAKIRVHGEDQSNVLRLQKQAYIEIVGEAPGL